ncbi:terminase small subunit [Paenirhodobacter populi]|uniref:DNA packaging protein n=1 Tax=Paenirhodobacter populi TaxID=2306993 RepID=A0A443IVE3_9RHOB|nr:terminase small subunit [Sinirhodobacter populi]RWR12051.1 hypothetical protein D2T33_10210 [Sinirhodobacter populi]
MDDFDDLLGGTVTAQRSALPDALPAQIKEAALADLLGVGTSRIRTLARDGILPKTGRGEFDTVACVKRYCARLRESAERAGRPSSGGDELKTERTRLAKEQADATALKNAQLRGELAPVAETLREWQAVLRDVRAAMLAVPSRYAASQPHLTPHDVEALTIEIKRALEGLADGND